jgi:hypothetical protein
MTTRTQEQWNADFEQLTRAEQLEVLAVWSKRAERFGLKIPPPSEPLVEHVGAIRASVVDQYNEIICGAAKGERRELWDADLPGGNEAAPSRALFGRDEVLDLMEQAFQDGVLAGGDVQDRSGRKEGT